MKAKIETYRGVDIYFETNSEKFICEVADEMKIDKNSYKSTIDAIDNYFRENKNFKPIKVITNPAEMYGGIGSGLYTIIGIRKDGRFIYEDDKGNKRQLAEHYEKSVILYSPEMDNQLVQIAYLETLVDEANQRLREAKEKVKGITLREYKRNLNIY
jgi:hypothetical protein